VVGDGGVGRWEIGCNSGGATATLFVDAVGHVIKESEGVFLFSF